MTSSEKTQTSNGRIGLLSRRKCTNDDEKYYNLKFTPSIQPSWLQWCASESGARPNPSATFSIYILISKYFPWQVQNRRPLGLGGLDQTVFVRGSMAHPQATKRCRHPDTGPNSFAILSLFFYFLLVTS
jgi:hypothetical protein